MNNRTTLESRSKGQVPGGPPERSRAAVHCSACGRSGSALTTLVILLVVVGFAAAGALLAAQGLTKGAGGGRAGGAHGESAPEQGFEFVPFGTLVANLSEERLTRYVKATITLKVPEQQAAQMQKLLDSGKKAVFQNWLLLYLSDRQTDDVRGGAALAKLQRDVQDGFNAILAEQGDLRVEEVLITECNIQ